VNQTAAGTAPDNQVFNSYVPVGANLVRYSDFSGAQMRGWSAINELGAALSAGVNISGQWVGPENYLWATRSGAMSAVQRIIFEEAFAQGVPVSPGDRLIISAHLGKARAGTTIIEARYWDASGSALGWSTVASPGGTVVEVSGSQADRRDTLSRVQGVLTVPATVSGSRPARITFYISQYGDGRSDPYLFVSCPMIERALANQTDASPFHHGQDADARADITGANISAGFTGSGALAYENTVTAPLIASGAVTTPAIASSAVTTPLITSGAVTQSSAAFTSGTVSVGTSWASVQSVSVGADTGETIVLQFSAFLTLTTTKLLTSAGAVWRIVRNGSTVVYSSDCGSAEHYDPPDISVPDCGLISAQATDTPGPGPHTYDLEMIRSGGGAGAVTNRALVALRLRR
jgi:hypothetical protein